MKVFWAFEPADLSAVQMQRMDELLRLFAPAGPELLHIEAEMFAGAADPHGINHMIPNRRDFRSDVEKALVKAKMEHGKVHYLSMPFGSLSEAVLQVLNYVRKEKGHLVGLFTHNKRGLERWLVGSFAETFIHMSPVDLLVASPKMKAPKSPRKLLFLDDFSNESRSHYHKALALSQRLSCELYVLHVPHFAYRGAVDGNNSWVKKYRAGIDQRQRWMEKEAAKMGVSLSLVFGHPQTGIVDQSLRLAKKKNVDLILVASKIGRLGAALGGSVARQVVRRSELPVYVIKSTKAL